jgi:hypothetical protein
MFWLALSSICCAWLLWTLLSLYTNYQAAKEIGLPISISPVHSQNPWWLLSHTYLVPLLRRLPWNLGKFTRCNYMGWQFEDKYALHEELGPAFVQVNPSKNELVLADPEAVSTVLGQRIRFIKPPEMYSMSLDSLPPLV